MLLRKDVLWLMIRYRYIYIYIWRERWRDKESGDGGAHGMLFCDDSELHQIDEWKRLLVSLWHKDVQSGYVYRSTCQCFTLHALHDLTDKSFLMYVHLYV